MTLSQPVLLSLKPNKGGMSVVLPATWIMVKTNKPLTDEIKLERSAKEL